MFKTSNTVNEITSQETKELLSKKEVLLIDCRKPSEWEEAHIEGAVLIPLDTLEEKASTLDTSQRIVCHCTKGGRSMKACKILKQNGFQDVSNLKGGITAWVAEGYPTE